MKTLVEKYNHRTGMHCASTAIRNLVYHYCSLDLSEPEVFGLGSGIDFIYLKSEQNDPVITTFGRGMSMEIDFATALGIDYREIPDFDNRHAWEVVRQEVAEGRPTMLSGDHYYLDYKNARDHFPAHRFVLLGFDDDRQMAIIADRMRLEYEECPYDKLALSRNPPLPISTYNLWGKFHDTKVNNNMKDAFVFALKRTVQRMLGDDKSQEEMIRAVMAGYTVEISTGLKGLAVYYDSFSSWRERKDCLIITKYAYNCIEKYGTGGGNFRKMYSNFLEIASQYLPGAINTSLIHLSSDVASYWTKLSELLRGLTSDSEDQHWRECHRFIGKILDKETQLFESLEKQLN